MNRTPTVRNNVICNASWWRLSVAAVCLAVGMTQAATAQLYVNEIFWDAGSPVSDGNLSGDDERDEYVELRGTTPGISLANHYLIFLENEDNSGHTGHAGEIDGFFDLGSFSMGSNGFLMLRQKGNLYDGHYGGVAAGTTDLVNAGVGTNSQGWGNNYTTPGSSTVGFSWDTQDSRNQIENGGFTAMLIQTDGMAAFNPVVGQDLDIGNNGLDPAATDVNNWRDHWTFIDAIGVQAEGNEVVRGRTYAQLNFGTIPVGGEIVPGTGILFTTPNIEPGATYVGMDWPEREIEYLGRWGNSTGQTADDWHVSNVTQRVVSGSDGGAPDYRQAGDPHPECEGCVLPEGFEIESNKNVAYGTPILDTLGDPNLGFAPPTGLMGDYNENDEIDTADYTVWRDAMTASATSLANDPTPGTVDETDFIYWRDHFGDVLGSGAGTGSGFAAVPEPASIVLLSLAGATLASCRKRRRRSTSSVAFSD